MVRESTDAQQTDVWSVRPYGQGIGDYQMVSGWMESRGLDSLVETTLPPHGVVVERDGEAVAASWLYLCYGIGVGFWEGLVSKPGLALSTTRTACQHCLGALKAIARENQTGIIKAYAKGPLAVEAAKNGFAVLGDGFASLASTT